MGCTDFSSTDFQRLVWDETCYYQDLFCWASDQKESISRGLHICPFGSEFLPFKVWMVVIWHATILNTLKICPMLLFLCFAYLLHLTLLLHLPNPELVWNFLQVTMMLVCTTLGISLPNTYDHFMGEPAHSHSYSKSSRGSSAILSELDRQDSFAPETPPQNISLLDSECSSCWEIMLLGVEKELRDKRSVWV